MTQETGFSSWLRDRMGAKNISGATLAKRLSVAPPTVYTWMSGASEPWSAQHGPLAEALGVTIDEIRAAIGADGDRNDE